MFRFVVTMLMGLVCAFLVFAACPKIVPGLVSFAVLALVLGYCLYLGDLVVSAEFRRRKNKKMSALALAGGWFFIFEVVPAGIIYAISQSGLFVLPFGLLTAFGMCLPTSVVVLMDRLGLKWLS